MFRTAANPYDDIVGECDIAIDINETYTDAVHPVPAAKATDENQSVLQTQPSVGSCTLTRSYSSRTSEDWGVLATGELTCPPYPTQ